MGKFNFKRASYLSYMDLPEEELARVSALNKTEEKPREGLWVSPAFVDYAFAMEYFPDELRYTSGMEKPLPNDKTTSKGLIGHLEAVAASRTLARQVTEQSCDPMLPMFHKHLREALPFERYALIDREVVIHKTASCGWTEGRFESIYADLAAYTEAENKARNDYQKLTGIDVPERFRLKPLMVAMNRGN